MPLDARPRTKLKQAATELVAACVRVLILALRFTDSAIARLRSQHWLGCADKAMPNNDKSKLEASLAELNRVLSARTDAASIDHIALRDAVCAYFVAERARGTPVIDFTRALKQLLRKAGDGGALVADALALQLVDWCVKLPLSPKRSL